MKAAHKGLGQPPLRDFNSHRKTGLVRHRGDEHGL
jgi:hypothetical protein